ncbi:MAG: hypothetical protein II135_06180, partial [Clostridia bacterium]|nr:hypothetical protein [Clostridia bacterium]
EVFFADKAVEERVIKRMEETAEGDLNLNKLSSEATEKVNRLTVKDCGDPLALPGQKAPENGRVLSEREYGLLVKDTKFLSEFFPVHEYNARRLKYLEYKDGRRAYDFGSELEELRKAENDIASPDYKFYCRAFRKAVAADNNRNVAADIKPVVCGVAFGKGESFEAEAEVFPSYKEFFVNCSALLRGMADRFDLISNDGYRIEIAKGGITAVERIDEKNASLTLTAEELDAVAGKSLESALDISGQISAHTVTAENGTVTFVFEKIPEPRQEK